MLLPYLSAAPAAQVSVAAQAVDLAPYVQEASRRTGIPEPVLWAVIHAESRGNARAISTKGALGVMQLMPKTWAIVRDRLNLGLDAFDPHDNIIAGAYYLRTLYDAYGWDGFLAAYNAGPGGYETYRKTGQPLPSETRNYVSAIAAKLGGQTLTFAAPTEPTKQPLWTEAALFISAPGEAHSASTDLAAAATPFVALSPSAKPTPQ